MAKKIKAIEVHLSNGFYKGIDLKDGQVVRNSVLTVLNDFYSILNELTIADYIDVEGIFGKTKNTKNDWEEETEPVYDTPGFDRIFCKNITNIIILYDEKVSDD